MASNKYLPQYLIKACKQHPECGRAITYKNISEGVGPALNIHANGRDYEFVFSQSPFNDKAVVDMVIDKARAQEVLSSHILMPETKVFSKEEGVTSITGSIRAALDCGELVYPLVVKPNKESLSKGVFIMRDESELEESLKRCAEISHSSRSILVQEYIPSDMELRVMFFEGEVMAIINKNLADIEQGRDGPGVEDEWGKAALVWDEDLKQQLEEMTAYLSDCQGLVYGGLDIRVDSRNGDLYLLEANPAPMGYEILEFSLEGGQDIIDRITSRMLDKILQDNRPAMHTAPGYMADLDI